MVELQTILEDFIDSIVSSFPKVVGAIIVLVIGWAAGRILGRVISRVLDKAGVDDALRKNVFGRALERSGITIVRFFDLVVRWFVYLIAIFGAVNVLEIEFLTTYMQDIVSYLPNLIAGVFILIIGLILMDFVADTVKSIAREGKIEYAAIIADGLRLFLYFVVIIMALAQMKIDVEILYIFANALAWGAALGLGAGVAIAVGWGLKDIVGKKAEGWMEKARETTKKIEETR